MRIGFLNVRGFFRITKRRVQTIKTSIKGKISQHLKIIRNLPEEIAYYEQKEQKADSNNILGLAFLSSSAFSGLLFIFIFAPLTWVSAKAYALNPIDVLLFAHIPELLQTKVFFFFL